MHLKGKDVRFDTQNTLVDTQIHNLQNTEAVAYSSQVLDADGDEEAQSLAPVFKLNTSVLPTTCLGSGSNQPPPAGAAQHNVGPSDDIPSTESTGPKAPTNAIPGAILMD
ncbi:hypothetical protein FRB97_006471, partial [Tulasnella sp. 331]